MNAIVNRRVKLKSRPVGIPQPEHFELDEERIYGAEEGEVLISNIFASVDPAMRGWVNAVGNYSEPVGLGEVMRAAAVGQVIESGDPRYAEGDIVVGMFGWQEYARRPAEAVERKVTATDLPISTALGVLGHTGITAYFALLDVGQPRAGETVLVSTAAGSVGSCAGQIARIHGCRTVGIAGGPVKAALCRDEFGYDAVIDYKNTADLDRAIAAECPDGVDVYFDNTAGPISDAAMRHLAIRARVVVCGTASIANWDPIPLGPRVERHLLVKRARMQGFLLYDYADRYHEAESQLAQWVRQGRVQYREDILDGLEHAPGAIAGLYRGDNLGKRLIRIAAEPLPSPT